MKFLLDIEIEPKGHSISPEEMREHIQSYVFGTDILMEMSLIPGDAYHELGLSEDYVSYTITSAKVEIVEE